MTHPKQVEPASEVHFPTARLTGWGWFWLWLHLGLPAMAVGLVADVLVQAFFGRCVGVWCIFL